MKRNRAIIGLCVFCALALSAIAAQSATATTKGTTAFTCKKAEGGFTDAHCKSAGSGGFKHEVVPENTKTEVLVSNETTNGERQPLIFKVTIAGTPIEVRAATVNSVVASIENKKAASGEHYVSGTDMISVTNVTVPPPCKVFAFGTGGTGGPGEKGTEGTIILHVLTATTEGQGDSLKFSPASGSVVAEFFLENCGGTIKAIGSVSCTPEGATCNFNHIATTTAGTLRANTAAGPKVGIEGTLTFSGRTSPEQAFTPLAPTTVETQ
jgi:hypothetical protein